MTKQDLQKAADKQVDRCVVCGLPINDAGYRQGLDVPYHVGCASASVPAEYCVCATFTARITGGGIVCLDCGKPLKRAVPRKEQG